MDRTPLIPDRTPLIQDSLRGFLACCLVCCAVLATLNPAWSGVCSPRQLRAAENAASDLGTWTKIHLFFSRFSGCDDGGIADDVTEAVVRLMSSRWEDLQLFADEAKKDPGFTKFVLTHVDSTADTDDLKKIRTYASQRCAPNLSLLCKQIGDAAQTALR
jgi:hypothetical protein